MTEVELEEVVGVESIVTAATTVSLVVVSVVYELFLAAEQLMDVKGSNSSDISRIRRSSRI